MRLLPLVSGTTLDSFHRDVYRPRLALLLLVVLLIFGQHDSNRKAAEISSGRRVWKGGAKVARFSVDDKMRLTGDARPNSLSGKVQTLLDKLPRTVRNDDSTVAVRYVDGQVVSAVKQVKEAGSTAGPQNKKADKSSDESNKRKGKESTTSILNRALNAEALSAIVSLHALWIIRLGSMVLEDYMGRESLSAKDSHKPASVRSTLSAVFAMAVSIALALVAATSSWVDQLERWKLATRLSPSSSTMIPVQMIVYLELCATLISLVGPLCRLNESNGLGAIMPKKLSIPSPSHSPSLWDMIPMPAAVSEFFRARAVASSAVIPPLRTRQRMAMHWASPNLVDRSLIASPGDGGGLPVGRDALQAGDRAPVRPPAPSGITLADPLRLPRSGKAPRMTGVRVRVETSWLAENFVTLFGHLVGALQYAIVAFSLPTLAPTSFPSLLSLLSLRSELGAVKSTWSTSRKSVECLEFVRRRWRAQPPKLGDRDEEEDDELLCPICFECVPTQAHVDVRDALEDRCTLDCGHQLHSICLVQWLNKQAFCPVCHATLRATPPPMRANVEGQWNGGTPTSTAAMASN